MVERRNAYEILGLTPKFSLEPTELERRQREQFALQQSVVASTQEAVNEAYRKLKDPTTRAELLFSLRGWSTKAPLDPSLLERVFFERDAIERAKVRGDEAFLLDWVGAARKRRCDLLATLGQLLDGSEGEPHPPLDALLALDELRYLEKALVAALAAIDGLEAADSP